jgi:hypothetical protein
MYNSLPCNNPVTFRDYNTSNSKLFIAVRANYNTPLQRVLPAKFDSTLKEVFKK